MIFKRSWNVLHHMSSLWKLRWGVFRIASQTNLDKPMYQYNGKKCMKDQTFELRRKIWSQYRSSHLIHNLSSCEIKSWKNSGLNRIQTHDLICNTGAVLYQLSYQTNCELVMLWVHNIPNHRRWRMQMNIWKSKI